MNFPNRRTILAAGAGLALLLSTGAIATYAGADGYGQHSAGEAPRSPNVIALLHHADWCGTCERMAPALKEAKKRTEDKPVLYVKLDYTNDTTATQSEYMLSALDLGDVFKEHGKKTGFVLLVDASSKEVVDRITGDMNAAAIAGTITRVAGR